MLKWIECTGKNDEAAIEAALAKLGLERDDVSVEVLERAKTGFLGIGSSPAKVKVTYEVPDEPVAPAPVKPAAQQAPRPVASQKPAAAPKPAAPNAAPREVPVGQTPAEDDDRAAQIVKFITGLMKHMGSPAIPQVTMDEQGNYLVDLLGEGLGSLIGRRGETLDAIQQLTGYAVNHGYTRRVRIHVDCENYRAKREEALTRLAEKVAAKVVKYRRNVSLEAMNAYERHVVHTALQDNPDVNTYSVGTEPNRRTVVAYGRGDQQG